MRDDPLLQSCAGDAQQRVLTKVLEAISGKVKELDSEEYTKMKIYPGILAEKIGEPRYLLYNHNIPAKLDARCEWFQWNMHAYYVVDVQKFESNMLEGNDE